MNHYKVGTHHCKLDIEGYLYDCEVDYHKYPNDEVEIRDMRIKNEEGEWGDMPFLSQVEEDLVEDILESTYGE